MWAEARKQERKIRGMLVDYRKRAERRQDFYEKIKADPTQFMQIHGRRCKIHLDPAVAAAGESPAIMMPWQGHADNLIDRFDVRAHLDYIPPVSKSTEPPEFSQDERQCNYESFRILAQNDFLAMSEDKFLNQLHLEEQFGVNAQQLEIEKAKKKSNSNANSGGAAIGYTYEDDSFTGDQNSAFNSANIIASAAGGNAAQEESDSDIDVDVSIDINKIDTQQAHELNGCGRNYGMVSNDFYSFLTKDADEAESLRMAREEEQEKIMLCGRKSRRERRAQREKRFAGRTISPPSYAAKEEPTKLAADDKNDSDSRSPTPENSGKITYITSFGGEDELTSHSKISINFNKVAKGTLGSELAANRLANAAKISNDSVSYADKVKQNLEKLKHLNDLPKSPRKPLAYQRRGHTNSRSQSRSRSKSSYHRNIRSRHSSRSRYRHSRSRSGSSSRRRRTYRRSRSRDRHRRRYSTSSSSSSSSSASKRQSKKRRSISSSSSSSSSSSKSSSSSSRSSLPGAKPISRSIERLKANLCSITQTKELEKPNVTAEKIPPPPQIPTIIAPVNPTPTEIPPSETALIREEPKLPEVQVPIKKYYGRKRDSQSSSSENEVGNEEDDSTAKTKFDTTSPTVKNINLGKAATIQTKDSSSGIPKPPLNPRDRLKKKMQILLNKQYKADKMAEIEKYERQYKQQQERDDEMREMALRLRRRQRELRHKYGSPGGDSDKSDGSIATSNRSSVSRSNREEPPPQKSKYRSRSRSRSRSKSYESRRRDRAKYSSRNTRESPRHRRSQEHNKRRSTSRDHRRRSKSNERRRNNDRPRKLVDY